MGHHKREEKHWNHRENTLASLCVLQFGGCYIQIWVKTQLTRSPNTTLATQSAVGGEIFDKTVAICVSICHYQIAEKNYEQIESHCICICQFQGWPKNREQNNVISALSMQSQNMDWD